LADPVANRLARRLELPSQLLRRPPGANQLHHPGTKSDGVLRVRLRHRGLLCSQEHKCPRNRGNSNFDSTPLPDGSGWIPGNPSRKAFATKTDIALAKRVEYPLPPPPPGTGRFPAARRTSRNEITGARRDEALGTELPYREKKIRASPERIHEGFLSASPQLIPRSLRRDPYQCQKRERAD